jgi:glutamine cyclotransferase
MYKGKLLANIYPSNNVAVIDPETGTIYSLISKVL